MKSGWAVVWRGDTCVMYLNAIDEWSLDPDDAFFFESAFEAQWMAEVKEVGEVMRCWV